MALLYLHLSVQVSSPAVIRAIPGHRQDPQEQSVHNRLGSERKDGGGYTSKSEGYLVQ